MTTPVSEHKVSPDPVISEEGKRLIIHALSFRNTGSPLKDSEKRRKNAARKALADYVSSLESQLEEARRDTERLDWLSSLNAVATNPAVGWKYDIAYLKCEFFNDNEETPLREAIDRAAGSARGAPHER